MVALLASMWVAVVGAIEAIDAIKDIIGSVWVNYVNNHADSHTMRSINKVFEFIRGPLSTWDSEIVGHMIPEASVICMLLYGHYLDHIIATFVNSREYVVCKIPVLVD